MVPPESEYGALQAVVLQTVIDCGERTVLSVTTVMSHPAKLKGIFVTVTLKVRRELTGLAPWVEGWMVIAGEPAAWTAEIAGANSTAVNDRLTKTIIGTSNLRLNEFINYAFFDYLNTLRGCTYKTYLARFTGRYPV